jgi:formylglycine-generating enzyme required for sulfatase activity
MEWELAARWRDNSTNTVAGYSNPWYTKGNSLSHATASYQNNAASYLVGVFYAYWDDTLTGVTGTMPVKSREPNSLGLYDMSGNVWEWCFDKDGGGTMRLIRSGSWCNKADILQLGVVESKFPYDVSPGVGPYVGFRVAKKKQ